MSKMLAAALDYASLGWPVFPCNGYKMPMIPGKPNGLGGVHDATTNPETIRAWWGRWPNANIGCHLGPAGLMAVDLDPGHDPEAVNRAFEGLPKTLLRQKTPRGGDHLLYALAEGEKISPSASRIAAHADVRSWGSYILLSPSHTVAGPHSVEGDYTWDHETAWPVQPRPKAAYRTDAMVRVCGEKREKVKNADVWLIEPDLPENIELAVKWMQGDNCQPAIEGQGGDKRTYDTAAMMRSYGLSEATALELLFQVYNAKCIPPWDYEELAVPVSNAYRYATSAPGNMTPAWRTALTQQLFKPQSKELPNGSERSAGKFRIVDGEGIEHIKEPEWLVPDFIAKGGYSSLSGPPGCGKSFVAFDIGMSIATGSGVGRVWPTVVEAGPVLMALGEGRPGTKARLKAWRDRHYAGAVVRDIFVADPVPLVSAGPNEWNVFCDLALDMSPEGYVLVIIDTATKALAGMNPNSFEHATQLTMMVNLLQTRLMAAVLVIFHTPHGDTSRAGGSYVFQGDPDTVLVLAREGQSPYVDLHMSKQKDSEKWEKPRTMKLESSGTSLVVVPAPPRQLKPISNIPPAAEVAVANLLDSIVARVLNENPGRIWTQKELAERLACIPEVGVPSRLIERKLKGLREDSASCSGKHYDADSRKWRWRG